MIGHLVKWFFIGAIASAMFLGMVYTGVSYVGPPFTARIGG